jgi:glycosyltransferase involved in cell wall biosynthesis
MTWRLVECELSAPQAAVRLEPHEQGIALIARWRDRLVGFHITEPGRRFWSAEDIARLTSELFGQRVIEIQLEAAFQSPAPVRAPPSLTIAVCTKDRAWRLKRLLASLERPCASSPFARTEILVIDNASTDRATRDVVSDFERARYVYEPKTGLDFARNAAVRNATGDLLAFLDDDVVVDRHWLQGLFAAWSDRPDAGGFTGLVLPFRLDTEAQVQFERRGGFGRGFKAITYHAARADNPLHPVGSGSVGAGCNMCFDRPLLVELGGFDEALDTGAPLPGGGDLDIIYRVLRAGRPIVYEPRYAVYHEHRQTLRQLSHQYWTWGLGFMAFLEKSRRSDPALRDKHNRMTQWWIGDKVKGLAHALAKGRPRDLEFIFFELLGGVVGWAGEYDRSMARVRLIRARAS